MRSGDETAAFYSLELINERIEAILGIADGSSPLGTLAAKNISTHANLLRSDLLTLAKRLDLQLRNPKR